MPRLELTHFDATGIPKQTARFNEELLVKIEAGPELWDLDRDMVRAARREGKGIFPLEPFDPIAETIKIEGSGGAITLRMLRPEKTEERGTFLHIHGGGWVYGNADMQDQRLKQLANETGLACVSVEYRLAPENPYPAAPDDCESAAKWLVGEGAKHCNTKFLAIGGESAGGHLAANCLLRLRDRHNVTPFHATVLIAGIFDLGMTPSAANFKSNLVLRHKDMVNFAACLLQKGEDRRDPDISPLYASPHDMPPAHFAVGTCDPLLDDSIFMANSWKQYQDDTELDIYPGGCHVFQYFDELKQTMESRAAMAVFLNRQIENHLA